MAKSEHGFDEAEQRFRRLLAKRAKLFPSGVFNQYAMARRRRQKPGSPATHAKFAVETYAATWRTSPDIRAKFFSFENYAAFMRAEKRGGARIYGRE